MSAQVTQARIPPNWEVWDLYLCTRPEAPHEIFVCRRLSLSGQLVCLYDEKGPYRVFHLGKDQQLIRSYPKATKQGKGEGETIQLRRNEGYDDWEHVSLHCFKNGKCGKNGNWFCDDCGGVEGGVNGCSQTEAVSGAGS